MIKIAYSLLNMKDNASYKETVLDSLCQSVVDSSTLRDVLDYVIERKAYLFEGDDFKGSRYEDDDPTLDLILPAVRRAWANFFVTPPNLFSEKRLEFFQLLFDVDEFLDYLAQMLPKVKSSLVHFDKLDRAVETMTLIVDNYVAGHVQNTNSEKDLISGIRDLKIKKTLKVIYRK